MSREFVALEAVGGVGALDRHAYRHRPFPVPILRALILKILPGTIRSWLIFGGLATVSRIVGCESGDSGNSQGGIWAGGVVPGGGLPG